MKDDPTFVSLFERRARRVRRQLLLRYALSGAAAGLLIALVGAGIAWKTRHGALRWYAASAAIAGAACGVLLARSRRWSDGDVALYLDDRLHTEETIATALELCREAEGGGLGST